MLIVYFLYGPGSSDMRLAFHGMQQKRLPPKSRYFFIHPVQILYRIQKALREDLAAFWPGSNVPITYEVLARSLLYISFLIFVFRLFLPVLPTNQNQSRPKQPSLSEDIKDLKDI